MNRKRFNHYFLTTEGVILCINIGDVHQFIGHYVIPLDPCVILMKNSFLCCFNNLQLTKWYKFCRSDSFTLKSSNFKFKIILNFKTTENESTKFIFKICTMWYFPENLRCKTKWTIIWCTSTIAVNKINPYIGYNYWWKYLYKPIKIFKKSPIFITS